MIAALGYSTWNPYTPIYGMESPTWVLKILNSFWNAHTYCFPGYLNSWNSPFVRRYVHMFLHCIAVQTQITSTILRVMLALYCRVLLFWCEYKRCIVFYNLSKMLHIISIHGAHGKTRDNWMSNVIKDEIKQNITSAWHYSSIVLTRWWMWLQKTTWLYTLLASGAFIVCCETQLCVWCINYLSTTTQRNALHLKLKLI